MIQPRPTLFLKRTIEKDAGLYHDKSGIMSRIVKKRKKSRRQLRQ